MYTLIPSLECQTSQRDYCQHLAVSVVRSSIVTYVNEFCSAMFWHIVNVEDVRDTMKEAQNFLAHAYKRKTSPEDIELITQCILHV